jgi:endoglucanase
MAYLSVHQMGWIACWYDDAWEPPMFTPGMQTPTHYGAFVLQQLKVP